MAAQLAVRSLARGSGGFDTTAARIVIDDASVLATRAVHQAHGAMGVTREYPLHHLSRRLWSWRHEYRSGAKWKQDLGRAAVAGGGAGLFTLVTG